MPELVYSVPLTPRQASVPPHLRWDLLDSQSQARLAQSLVGSLLLSPGSWYAKDFVRALQESVSKVPWKSCSQIPLVSKVQFLWGFSVPLLDPQVGKSVVGPELLQQCKNFFDVTVLQFVVVCSVALWGGLTRPASQACCSQSPWALVPEHVVIESLPSVPVTEGLVEE